MVVCHQGLPTGPICDMLFANNTVPALLTLAERADSRVIKYSVFPPKMLPRIPHSVFPALSSTLQNQYAFSIRRHHDNRHLWHCWNNHRTCHHLSGPQGMESMAQSPSEPRSVPTWYVSAYSYSPIRLTIPRCRTWPRSISSYL